MQPSPQRFYSNGKLLLTGEYVVLDGANALALPTKFGQDLTVNEGKKRTISWTSIDIDGKIWFEDIFTFDEIINNTGSHSTVKDTLTNILHQAYLVKPEFIMGNIGYSVKTTLTFPRLWGLGTSSTLLNNIAQWLEIDAYNLLKNSFGGSGYDIAAAQHNHPIVYKLVDGKPIVSEATFNPAFKNRLYFVYLNRKQNSQLSVKSYKSLKEKSADILSEINHITSELQAASSAAIFSDLINKHEEILSKLLSIKTVKQTHFPDFDGSIKSLGGWGGDFILVVSNNDPKDYFNARGFQTVIPYTDMIL